MIGLRRLAAGVVDLERKDSGCGRRVGAYAVGGTRHHRQEPDQHFGEHGRPSLPGEPANPRIEVNTAAGR